MLKLTILSPERKLVAHQEIQAMTLTGSEGQIQILEGHSAMIGTLETGIFRYQSTDGAAEEGLISSGFFEVKNDEVIVLAETLELRSEIDISRAKLAQQKAEEALKDANLDEHQFKKYQLKLQRAIIRQQFAERMH